jgi:hypothetical protein
VTKLKRTLALALAGGALAIGVPAALAAGGGDEPSTQPSGPALIQDQGGQDRQDRGDGRRGDCPEKNGQGGSSESGPGSSAPQSDATTEL